MAGSIATDTHNQPPGRASSWAQGLGRVFRRVAIFDIDGTQARVASVHGMGPPRLGAGLSLVDETPLRWAVAAASPIVGAGAAPGGAAIAAAIGLSTPRAYAVIPLATGGRLVALAYVDQASEPLPLGTAGQLFSFCDRVLRHGNQPPKPPRHGHRSTARRERRARRPDLTRRPRGVETPALDPMVEAAAQRALLDLPEELEPELARNFAEAELDSYAFPDDGRLHDGLGGPDPRESQRSETDGEAKSVSETDGEAKSVSETDGEAKSVPETNGEAKPVPETGGEAKSVPAIGGEARSVPEPPPLERHEQRRRRKGRAAAGTPRAAAEAGAMRLDAPAEPVALTRADNEPQVAELAEYDEPVSTPESAPAVNPPPQPAPSPPAPSRSVPEPAPLLPVTNRGRSLRELAASGDAVVTPEGVVAAGTHRALTPRRRRWLAVFGAGLIVLGGLAAVVVTPLAPVGSVESGFRLVQIPRDATVPEIAAHLEGAGVVRNARAFRLLARVTGTDRALRAGAYRLPTGAWAHTVLGELHQGQVQTRTFTVPEGLTLAEVAQLLESEGLARATDILREAYSPELLARYGIPASNLEGYLFPETYTLAKGLSAREILTVMLDEFRARVTGLAEGSDLDAAALHRTIILASIVEREARDHSEYAKVAGVFANRLERNMRLESCATVQYILGEPKARLTYADVRRESPYNTYLNPGLPPGPISNPGLFALDAALVPEKHDFLFFFAREDGSHKHVFSRTFAAHKERQRRLRAR